MVYSNMEKTELLKKIQKKLIVSCQARVGWAMYGSDIMAAFAKAAEEGGAAGIRATGVDNISKIKEKVKLPVIGINKQWVEGYEVYITPTYKSAKEILDTGIEIIALDATGRKRPNGETFESIMKQIRKEYPEVSIMAEISTLEEAKAIIPLQPDLISTTLSGYTEASKTVESVNIELVKQITEICNIPVIAEGKIRTADEAVEVLNAGAFSVVVGTSITRPEIITSRYVETIKEKAESNI